MPLLEYATSVDSLQELPEVPQPAFCSVSPFSACSSECNAGLFIRPMRPPDTFASTSSRTVHMPPIATGHRSVRLTREQLAAPTYMGHVPGPMSPRSEMMAREMDSIIFSPRGKDARMAMSALALSPRNVNLANLTKHMNGEDVPKFAGGVNAQLRARAAVQANFGIRTVQLLNPLDKQEPRDNPPFPNWWSGGYGASAQQTMSPRCLPQDGLDEPLPAAPPGPRPAGLPRRQAAPKGPTLPAEPPSPPPNDPAEEAAAAVLQREVRAHAQVARATGASALRPHPLRAHSTGLAQATRVSGRRHALSASPMPTLARRSEAIKRCARRRRDRQRRRRPSCRRATAVPRIARPRHAPHAQSTMARGGRPQAFPACAEVPVACSPLALAARSPSQHLLARCMRALGSAQAVAVKDQSLQKWHKILQKHITTRFSTFRGCFRLIDVDSSGSCARHANSHDAPRCARSEHTGDAQRMLHAPWHPSERARACDAKRRCDRKEMKTMLNAMFNLEVPSTTMDQMIDLADVDGDGVVRCLRTDLSARLAKPSRSCYVAVLGVCSSPLQL